MKSPEHDLAIAREIAEAVHRAGGSTYFVGGYVRDRLLGKENKDIDLEIHGITDEQLRAILGRIGEPVAMGSSFGIYGLRHCDLDIALPRKEHEAGRGHREFQQFVDPFIGTERAAMRRDLTINALMQDAVTGEIIDHFHGQEDLKQGVIRHVNEVTFAEDPLRVLRAAQFAARFRFSVAPETIALCKALPLRELARERILGEVEKALLKAERPSRFFEVLREMDQLGDWFPELEALIGVEQDPVHHPEGDVWNHTMLVLDAAATLRDQAARPFGFMLAALCHDFGKATTTALVGGRIHAYEHEIAGIEPAERFLTRLSAENKLHDYVRNMTELHMRPNQMAAQNSRVKSMCKLYDSSVCPEDLLLLSGADHCSRPNASPYEATEQFLRKHLALYRERMAMPHVKGEDLVQAGFRPGKDFGEALEYAHKLRLAGEPKDRALRQTIAYLRKLRP